VLLQRREGHDLKRPLMSGGHDHVGGRAIAMSPQPVSRRHAPAVPRHEPRETELRHRGNQIVADAALVLKELSGHHGADRVASPVFRPGVTAPIPVEAGDRVRATRLQFTTHHITVTHTGKYPHPGHTPASTRAANRVPDGPARPRPRRRWLNGHLVLARQIVSPRFLRVQELSPHNVVHTFRLTSPADVDAQFVTWLAEATGSAPRSTCTADKHRAEAAAADSGVWMTVQRSTQTRETRRTTWQSLC